MRIAALAFFFVACGADSSRQQGSARALEATEPVQVPTGVSDARVSVDAGAAVAHDCYCFSWVHLDENGEQCYPTKPTCDAEYAAFGRDMKLPCEKDTRGTCASFACRGAGKECFRL